MNCYLIEQLTNNIWTPIELRVVPLDQALSGRHDQRARRMRRPLEAMMYRVQHKLDTVIHPALIESGTPIQWEDAA